MTHSGQRQAGRGLILRALRSALDQIDHATRQPQKSSDDNLLRLKLPPTFAIRWLIPRLAAFHALHPSIDVQITTSHDRADFDREDIDACTHSERETPTGPGVRRLIGEVLLPVCSPRLLKNGPRLMQPVDLAHHVEDDLRSGRLVAPIPLPLRTPDGYYLAYAPDRPTSSRLLAFEAWVVGAAAAQIPKEKESGFSP